MAGPSDNSFPSEDSFPGEWPPVTDLPTGVRILPSQTRVELVTFDLDEEGS